MAYRNHHIDHKPLDRMQKPTGSQSRDRVLTDDELRKLWNALEDNTFGRIVKLLILTGQRETEISHLTADMIKGNEIALPSWLTKNKREHTFPIAPVASSLVYTPQFSTEKSAYIFPAQGKPSNCFNGWSKCKAALDQRCGVTNWRIHDLRRTYATNLQRLGIKTEVIEHLLNHISGYRSGVTGVYQRHTFMPEMRQAVEKFDAWFQALLA